jgi:hypothetical protein
MSWVATAIVGGAVIGGAASYLGASKSAGAISDAAQTDADVRRMIYNDQTQRWEPYEEFGKAALPGLSAYDAEHPLPSYERTVAGPLEDWRYEQTPAYKAKFTLGMETLNDQLQARGLAPSAIGANRAADLSRRLTSEDYATERAFRLGTLQDVYKSKFAENTEAYNRLLDRIKVGQGAAGALGQAGNVYATGVGESAMRAGEAKAGFYAGLPGAMLGVANTGLKAYDTGMKAGWWGDKNPAPTPNTDLSSGGYEFTGLPEYNFGTP